MAANPEIVFDYDVSRIRPRPDEAYWHQDWINKIVPTDISCFDPSPILKAMDVKVVYKKLAPGYQGIAYVEDNIVGISCESPPKYRRYVLAHELGHIWNAQTFGRDSKEQWDEALCNLFAADLLFPMRWLYHGIGPDTRHIAHLLGIPPFVIVQQLLRANALEEAAVVPGLRFIETRERRRKIVAFDDDITCELHGQDWYEPRRRGRYYDTLCACFKHRTK